MSSGDWIDPHDCSPLIGGLTQVTDPGKLTQRMKQLRRGFQVPCPECGRIWQAQSVIVGGGTVMQWVCVQDTPELPPLSAQIAAIAARRAQPRQAQIPVVALAVNATVDLTGKWDGGGFPDASYATSVLLPAVLIGKVDVTVKAQTASIVTVTVKATQVVVAGSTLNVIGVRWA